MVCLGLVREILGSSTFGRHFPDIRSVLSHSRDYLLSKHAAFMIEFLQCFGYILLMNFLTFEYSVNTVSTFYFSYAHKKKYKVDHIKVNNDAIYQTVL